MDWKNLRDNASIWTTKATEMAKKWFETSKEYAEKTGVWSYAKLKESKFVLRDISSYEALGKEKRYAIFCIREGDAFGTFFLTFLPIVFTKAWIESGSIRIILEEWSEELRKAMGIEHIPSVLVKMDDGSIRKMVKEEEVRTFIKNLSFYEKWESEPMDNAQNKADPLDTL